MIDAWPYYVARSGFFGFNKEYGVSSPYGYQLISINPDVYIVRGDGIPTVAKGEKPGPAPSQPISISGISVSLVTEFRLLRNLAWFAPEFSSSLTPLEFDADGKAVYDLGSVEIHCQSDGEGVACTRTGDNGWLPEPPPVAQAGAVPPPPKPERAVNQPLAEDEVDNIKRRVPASF